MTDDITL